MIKEIKLNEFDTKYILIIDNTEVSFVETHKLYEVLDIINVKTIEEERRKGYAYRLLKYIIDNTTDSKIMLEVNEENKSAIKLYEKLGFKKISERKNYYKDKTALIMEVLK